MAAATVQPLMSLETYLRTDFEPDAEYVDGIVEERFLGEFDHASWQDALQAWFRNHAADWNLRARPEYRVRVSPTRYRVPDVTVMDRALPSEPILTLPPMAVFEVLSPEDRMGRVLRKLADYETMGIANIFVIDPETRCFYQFRNGTLGHCTEPRIDLANAPGFVDWEALEGLLY